MDLNDGERNQCIDEIVNDVDLMKDALIFDLKNEVKILVLTRPV